MKKPLIFLLFLGLLGISVALVFPFKTRAGVSVAQCAPSVNEAVVGEEVTFSAQIQGTYSSLRWYDITNSAGSGTPPNDAVLVGTGSSLKLKFNTSGIKKLMLCPVWQQFNCYPAATCQVIIKPQSATNISCGDDSSRCVFVTSNIYYPDFGGPEGGDKICNDLAKAAGLPGTYKAWLSGTDFQNRKAINVADRLEHSSVPYKLVDGTIVANNWNDLTTKPLLHAINLNERGEKVAPRWVWTGSMPNGQRTPASIGVVEPDCYNWSKRYACCASCGWNDSTNNDPRGFDPVTKENIIPQSWGGEMNARLGCNQKYHLYCFQQSTVSGSNQGVNSNLQGGTAGGSNAGQTESANTNFSLKATPLTALSKTVYTNQYATFKIQIKNTSSQTISYKLRASSTSGLDKLIITPQTLSLKPGASRTLWIFAKDKDPGNYQISVEAANSAQKELFTLTAADLWVKSRSSRTPSVTPVSPPQNEIPSPPQPVTSGGGASGGSGIKTIAVPATEKTVGVPGLTQAEREAGYLPNIIWNPYAQVFQDQYKGYYPSSIASQYQGGIYQGNTIQYEGKTLVVAKRCYYHHSLSDPGFAFGAYGGPEAFVEYSSCWNTWVDASSIRTDASGNDLNACSSNSDCVQRALSLINQKKKELEQTKSQEKKDQCVSGETHCIGKEIWTCVNGQWQTQTCPTYCTSQDRCKGVNDSPSAGSSSGSATTSSGTSSGGGGGHMFYYNYLPPAYFNLPFAFIPVEFFLASFGQIWSR